MLNRNIKILFVIACIILIIVIFFVFRNNKYVKKANIKANEHIINTTSSIPPFSEFYDFENVVKGKNEKSLYNGLAFSGATSTKAFGINSFSFIIEKKASDIGLDNLSKIAMRGSIYLFPLRDTLKSALVLTISSANGETKYWKGIEINGFDNLPIKEWFYVSGDFLLNDIELADDDMLSFYLWNNSDNDMLLDDLFIVYGKESERFGEKYITDLTSNNYKTYGPPYQLNYFYKNHIPIIFNKPAKKTNISSFFNENLIVSGHFLDHIKGVESIISFNDNAYLYHYCKDKYGILSYEINIPENLNIKSQNLKIISADFNGDGFDEVLFFDKNDNIFLIYNIDKKGNICDNDLKISLKEFYNSKSDADFVNNIKKADIFCTDFNMNNKSDLLIVYEDFNWSLNEWNSNKWHNISKGFINYFSKNDYEISVYCGKIPYNTNGIIIYGKNLKINSDVFEIMIYSNSSKKFESISNKSVIYNGYNSIVKQSKFYFANISNNKMLLNFDNSEYFDFKALNLVNDTLKVLYNIDFNGYTLDNNPKYYEYLNILSGNFISPEYTSLITIAGCFTANDDKKQIIGNKLGFPAKIEIYSPNIY